MLIGALIGGIIGFAAPIALHYIVDADQYTGSGTLFAFMWFFSLPFGVGLGVLIAAVFGGALRD
jgi:hypothetical protein